MTDKATCTCSKEWRKQGPDAVNRQGHEPDVCQLEIERVAGASQATHVNG